MREIPEKSLGRGEEEFKDEVGRSSKLIMKKKWTQLVLILGIVLSLGACSTSKKSDEASDPDMVPASTDAGTDAVPAPQENTAEAVSSGPGPASQESGGTQSYTVQKYDTLMKIAFNTYGDVYKWKEIFESNKDKISDPNNIKVGTVLSVGGSGGPSPANGEKYLIKKGDTLGKISGELYGTPARWKELWENNRQMIHDPNRIFAGFYLYYVAGQLAPVASTSGVEQPSQAISQPSSPAEAPVAGASDVAPPPPAESQK